MNTQLIAATVAAAIVYSLCKQVPAVYWLRDIPSFQRGVGAVDR